MSVTLCGGSFFCLRSPESSLHGGVLGGLLLLNWVGADLPGDGLAVRSRDREHTSGAHLDALVLSSVEDLQDVLAELVAGARLHRSALEQHLDIS